MRIELDRPDCYGYQVVWWLSPESAIRGRLNLFGIPLPIWRRRLARDIRIGDNLNGGNVINVLY